MTPEEIGMAHFGISLRDSDFAHIKTPEEMTEKTMAAVMRGIQMAIEAEREACAQTAESCDCAGINDIWPAAQRAIAADIRARTT